MAKFISESQVSRLLNWESTFEAVKVALECQSTGRAVQNERSFTDVPKNGNLLLTMPGFLDNDRFGGLGCKLVTVCPGNAGLATPLPSISANITLFDENTGALKAVIAGTAITTWRTAAASVVATKYLTKDKNLKTLAIMGAGTQGRIHAIAFQHFFKFEEVRVWNHNFSKAEKLTAELNQFAAENGKAGIFRPVKTNQACVIGADVIITTTFATKPIVQLEWVKPGAHINAIGAGNPEIQELSDSIYGSSDVFVDHADGAKKELARLLEAGILQSRGEIGEVITGKLSVPVSNRITVFQSLGMAVEDCAMARMIYDLHEKQTTEQ